MNNATLDRFFENPYPLYAQLRQRGVVRDEVNKVWQVGTYENVDFVLKDPRFGKAVKTKYEDSIGDSIKARLGRGILNLDPPEHTRARGLMVRGFSATRTDAMRPNIHRVVNDLLDKLLEHGEADVMKDFALPIPTAVVGSMLGIPVSDRAEFLRLANEFVHYSNEVHGMDLERAWDAVVRMDDYLAGFVKHKRANPGDDLTSDLIRAVDKQGQKLSDEELVHNICLLFIAGHESTVNLIGNALIALHKFPEQIPKLLNDRSMRVRSIEEFIRYDCPVQQLHRIANESLTLGDQRIEAGSMVVCVLGAANRDPRVYEEPDLLRLGRPFHRSKAFGGGVHFCLGAQLARIEVEIGLCTLLERLPDLQIDAGDGIEYPHNAFFRGPKALRVRWS